MNDEQELLGETLVIDFPDEEIPSPVVLMCDLLGLLDGDEGSDDGEEAFAIEQIHRKRECLRQLMVLMELPFFALKAGRTATIQYHHKDGRMLEISAGGCEAIATVFDADILSFIVTEFCLWTAAGQTSVCFRPVGYFKKVQDACGGDQYRRLLQSLKRLTATKVRTNIDAQGKRVKGGGFHSFTWLESVEACTAGFLVRPAQWLIDGALSNHVLPLDPGYFALSGPFQRRLYQTARKHCGHQKQAFQIRVQTLFEKFPSAGSLPRFRHEIRRIVYQDAIPGHSLKWIDHRGGAALVEMRHVPRDSPPIQSVLEELSFGVSGRNLAQKV